VQTSPPRVSAGRARLRRTDLEPEPDRSRRSRLRSCPGV